MESREFRSGERSARVSSSPDRLGNMARNAINATACAGRATGGWRKGLAAASFASALLLSPVSAATVGTVFVSYADGGPRYASQRLDASYRLFIRGKTVRKSRSRASATAGRVSRQRAQRQLAPLIEHYARVHQVTPALVAAVVAVESGFDAGAVSARGATGAMQLMPVTAARYGVTNSRDPAQNIDAGVRHLKRLLNQHHGNVALALAAYNAGQGAVARNGGRIPPYRETMLYVPAVLSAAARGSSQ